MKENIKHHLAQLPSSGVWCAALTPLQADLSIDNVRLIEYARFLLDNGCHGIGLFGTTGEANSFSVTERMLALESLLGDGLSPSALMVGTGCCSSTDTVSLTRHAIELGVKKILMLPPFYYKKVSDQGLFCSYAHVINRIARDDWELYLYHFPAQSQTPISAKLITQLCEEFPGTIAGIKDSSSDLEHTLSIAAQFPKISIFPGNETHLLEALENGCAGCISGITNSNPQVTRELFDSCLEDDSSAETLQEHAMAIRAAFGRHPLIAGLKQYAAWSSSDDAWLRLRPPLTRLDDNAAATLRSDLLSLGMLP